jgi:sulfatase maturation enzyme AslB (radical SAM superfamily)
MDVPMTVNVLDFVESIVYETGQRKVSVMFHGGEPLAAGHEVIEALFRDFMNVLAIMN